MVRIPGSSIEIRTKAKRRSNKTSFFTNIISRDTYIEFNNEKLDALFFELKGLPAEKKYSFAILLRTLLEQSLYVYLETKNLIEDAGLKAKKKKKQDNESKVKNLINYIDDKSPGIKSLMQEDDIMNILKFNPSNNNHVDSSLKTSLDYVKNHILPQYITDQMQLKDLNHYIDRIKDGLDLAVHNPVTAIDVEHNKRAWKTLEPVFEILSIELLNN